MKRTRQIQKIIHCRNGTQTTAISFHVQSLKQRVRGAQSHLEVYKKKYFAKTWLRFFLGALEVRALKSKYGMESVNHKI